jgi:hypothetical protein
MIELQKLADFIRESCGQLFRFAAIASLMLTTASYRWLSVSGVMIGTVPIIASLSRASFPSDNDDSSRLNGASFVELPFQPAFQSQSTTSTFSTFPA